MRNGLGVEEAADPNFARRVDTQAKPPEFSRGPRKETTKLRGSAEVVLFFIEKKNNFVFNFFFQNLF